ncbi:hypothetical protein P879_05168 [Paragonimus westermani]|uniref:Uncharacterized protein n=1 Tax=Paragonimus westermani TaxID=34504 RepID=A0A8T0D716_9TREM|nr:hypothetical protein P879_05168 [Paragonimus westermani]
MIMNGLGEQLGSVGLVEMMRLPCLLFTWIKFSCALMSTCLCLVYFSTKPPAIHAFPALFIMTLLVNLLVATSILSIPQMDLFPKYPIPSPINGNLDEYAHELPAVSLPHRKRASITASHSVQHRASQTKDPFI